ncbi:MAG: hypothetical protein AB7O67_20890 [Vicinamibacterales bacterium]
MARSRVVALFAALALAVAVPASVLAQKDDKKRSKEEQREIEQLVKVVDAAMAGEAPAASDITMELDPYFLKSQDQRTFVPFVLTFQNAPAANVAMYVRVVDMAAWEAAKDKKKFEYPWDDIHFIDQAALKDGRLNRVFMAPAGTYDVFVVMKERLPEKAPKNAVAKMGMLKTQVTVPDFWSGELQTSSVIATDNVTMLTAPIGQDEARERPFVFGAQELVPATDMNFKKNQELSIFFQVYNAGLDSAGKPNLVMEYNFHRTENGEEKFFNKTNPQNINASNLPPQFDPSKFPVPGGITVPLATFPVGEFRLEIKITDKAAGKELTKNVNFTVEAS